jgi:hypothetical protein
MNETPTPLPMPAATPTAAPTAARRCDNCGSPLLGEHCYACGQPTKGLVRHFSSIIGDFFDSVFNFDTRTLRTLGPLLTRPGYLSNEYFHGHRVRYVSPVRLFFFLCIAAFFALQLTVDIDLAGNDGERGAAIARAESVAEVEKLRDAALERMREARARIPDAPGARVGIDVGVEALQAEARRRIAWLERREAARARGETVPPYQSSALEFDFSDEPEAGATGSDGEPRVRSSGPSFNGKPWDPVTNPVSLDWLPASGNAALNQLIGRAKTNSERIQKQPRLLVDAFIEALPQTLFVLLPLFALLLKILHLFARRLYMEHLIVALHSHAFLCASILILVGVFELRDHVAAGGFWHGLLGWVEAAIFVWMPLYLLLMQKRVYRQGWILTLLKFGVLGLLYTVLLSFGAALNLAVSVVAM